MTEDKSTIKRILNFLLDPIIFTSVYLIFFLLAQVQILHFYLGYTQYALVAWALVIMCNEYLVKRNFIKTPGLFIYAPILIVSGVSLIYNYSLSPITQIKSAILLAISVFIFYPLGVAIAKKETPEKDLAVLFLPSLFITFMQSIASLYTLFTVYSFLGEYHGSVICLGLQEFKYNSGAQALILFGFNVDSNHAAIFGTVSVLLSTWFYIHIKKIFSNINHRRIFSVFYWIGLITQIPCIVLSNSRASSLVLAIAIPFIGLFWVKSVKKHLKYSLLKSALILVLGTISALAVVSTVTSATEEFTRFYLSNYNGYTETSTDKHKNIDLAKIEYSKGNPEKSARPIIWRESFEVFMHTPIVGTGPYNSEYYARKYNIGDPNDSYLRHGKAIHNSYLDVIVSYGILGFAVYLGFFIYLLNKWRKRAISNVEFDLDDLILGFCWINIMGGVFFLTDSFLGADYLFTIILIIAGYLAHKAKRKSLPVLNLNWINAA